MMVFEPEKLLNQFIEAGSNTIIFHYEAVSFPYRLFYELKKKNINVGIAINPKTPVFCLEGLLEEINTVLVLCVEPGFAGGKFIPSSIVKVKEIRKMIEKSNLDISIGVDGGVNEKTIPLLIKSGANILVVGSTSIFRRKKDYKKGIEEIRKLIKTKK